MAQRPSSSLCWITLLQVLLCVGAQQQRPRDVTDADQIPNVQYSNPTNLSEGSQQLKDFDTVFEFLIGATAPDGFATCLGYGNFLNPVFGHTACYTMPDRSSCIDCLRVGYNEGSRSRTIGFRYWRNESNLRCNIQYETNNFTMNLPSDTLGILGPNASVPSPPPTGSSSTNTSVIVGAVVGSLCGALLLAGAVFCLLKRRRKHQRQRRLREPHDDLAGATRAPVVFSHQDLSSATANFSQQNKLGQGGFGPVYKARLGDGSHLAVKQLQVGSQQGKKEFVNEISIITSIQHRNLVKLVGYCAEGDHRLLVYEFLENGSLDRAIFGKYETLDWPSRVQIILGVAKGLAYLHEESHVQIIHRDIKASNILLDRSLQPKISDFGISKLEDVMNKGDTTTTRVAGTLGYMAPEYVTRGRLSTKVDVFSFGVLVLEIISGRKCMDPEEEILLQKTWTLYNAGRLEEIFDPRLEKNYDAEEGRRVVHVAMLCAQEFEESRPVMSKVVAMLMGFLEIPPLSQLQAPMFYGQQQGWISASSGTGTTGSSAAAFSRSSWNSSGR